MRRRNRSRRRIMHETADDVSRPDGAPARRATDSPRGAADVPGLAVIDHLMAGGEMVPAQLPSATNWSAEKKLAAAVLASALVEVRDHHGKPGAPPPGGGGPGMGAVGRQRVAVLVPAPLRTVRPRGRLGPRRGAALGRHPARGAPAGRAYSIDRRRERCAGGNPTVSGLRVGSGSRVTRDAVDV